MIKKNVLDTFNTWLNSEYIDKEDREELKKIENNPKEIEDRFYTNLSFGTGGMRGVRGVGSNRINKYTIRKATQGLANYIITSCGELGKKMGVAIAYDCRIGSEEYALNSALVLAANGIKAYLFKSLRSTPELSFAVRELKTVSGIVITASHNPKEYNGYKVYWKDGGQAVEPQASGILNSVNNIDSFDKIKFMDKDLAINKGLIEYIDESMDTKFLEAVKLQIINKDIPGKENFKIVYSPLHGTGGRPVKRVFSETGFNSLNIVPEQEQPDGNFPTCSYANPEEPAVFKLATELADKIDAKLCLATDPDGDRVGVAVKDSSGDWFYPNGNQIGLLLMDYILENKKNIPKNATVISTIVSTPMLDVVGKSKNINLFRTLTGFKYIGEKMTEFEEKKYDATFLMGFEESYGYLIGTHVRDKDAIVSSLLIAEMAAYYESINSSITSELRKLYEKYGFYKEGILSVTKKGKDGAEAISNIMSTLRNTKYDTLLGKKVIEKIDFENDITTPISLPKSNVIQFILEDKTYITARPSGTEPKIKYYFCVVDSDENSANKKLEKVMTEFESFINLGK